MYVYNVYQGISFLPQFLDVQPHSSELLQPAKILYGIYGDGVIVIGVITPACGCVNLNILMQIWTIS